MQKGKILDRELRRDQMDHPFIIQVSEQEIRREKDKARALRKTRWWQQRLARGLCHYCRRRFPPAELTLDHILPIIRGGKTTRGNVVPACKECNSKKKYLLPGEWDAYLNETLPTREDS
jgi:5-methylcytosine-specific restriction protein A